MPKIHKANFPLRPIISTINSPTHFLAKILYNELKDCFPKPKSHINNSLDFKKKINNLFIPDNYVFISLDVCSLFTNILCDLVLHSIDKRIHLIRNKCKLSIETIRHIIKFLFSNTYFSFNNIYYKQIFGSPMGSPVSPLFADIVMEDLETNALLILKNKFNITPIIYVRYVDDSFLCVNKNSISTILDVFNNYDTHLQFTH